MPYGSHVVPDRRQMVHLRAMCNVWGCLHHMGAMCALYKADGPLRRVGAIWEPALAVWELYVLYRSHVRYGRWMAPHGGNIRHMGAIWEPCALYRSHMAPFERKMVPHGAPMHHMGAACTICAIWEPCVHYGMQRAAYGSCVQAMGAMFSGLHHIGATCALWEPHTPYGSRYDICQEDGITWAQNAIYGGHIEAECAEWELCVPYWR
jgi:hypothetical protein